MNDAWKAQYLAQPEPTDSRVYALAQQYHERCEAFDRTVCTGPIGRDGIIPADHRQLAAINRHAIGVFRELAAEAANLGCEKRDFQRLLSRIPPPVGEKHE